VRRLRAPVRPLVPGDVVLDDAVARYTTRVHRLRVGDAFVAFDPEARLEADAEILGVGRDVTCRIGPVRASLAVARTAVTLLQALGKGEKPEQVIRDATALGVERIVLVETTRAVVRLEDERAATRRRRWTAVAVEAARQCGRGDVPAIDGPLAFDAALELGGKAAHRIYLAPRASRTLVEALGSRRAGETLSALIGPEGGFDPSEESLADAAGFVAVRLGDFVLRTETAAIAALAVIIALGG
jgi:16S rRNA (uracil1498-N3)-methyltransferase